MGMLRKPFEQAKFIIETIESFHHEAYFVGGAVRDLLLEKDVNDIDIATSATPEQVQKMFDKVIPVGIEHGTVLVRYEGDSYEVTTYRQGDDLTEEKSIEVDLNYRDFTINALAIDKDGHLIDLFSGQEDLTNKIIRAVGSAKDRFNEDPLRLIRALRFVSQLGFTIEEETLNWMKKLKSAINELAMERVTAEMASFFQGPYVNEGITYLIDTNIYKHLPLFKQNEELIKHLPKRLIPLHSFGEVICLLHMIYPKLTIRDWVKHWKCSNAMKREADQLYAALTYYETNRLDQMLVYRLDQQYYNGFCRLTEMLYPNNIIRYNELDELYESLPIKSRSDINFNGNDLITLFPHKKRGRWISQTIEQIEEEIILNNLQNKYDVIEEWAICNPPEVN